MQLRLLRVKVSKLSGLGRESPKAGVVGLVEGSIDRWVLTTEYRMPRQVGTWTAGDQTARKVPVHLPTSSDLPGLP